MIKNYKWKYNDNFIFELIIGDIINRFQNEGIHQSVEILVYNIEKDLEIRLLITVWGTDHSIEMMKNVVEQTSYIRISKHNIVNFVYDLDEINEPIYYMKMEEDKSAEFLEWLDFCYLPINKQRKLKLNKWKEKQ